MYFTLSPLLITENKLQSLPTVFRLDSVFDRYTQVNSIRECVIYKLINQTIQLFLSESIN